MHYAVIAYPKFDAATQTELSNLTAQFTQLQRDAIPPHFTLVFPFTGVDQTVMLKHMQSVAAQWQHFPLHIRCAMPFIDIMTDNMYVYLVPDEGMSAMVRLHDALYKGPLQAQLRLDIPFVPHITVGFTPDAAYCKQAADAINMQLNLLTGAIHTLTVLQITEKIDILAEFALQ